MCVGEMEGGKQGLERQVGRQQDKGWICTAGASHALS